MCGAAAGDRDGPGSRFTAVIFDMDAVSPTPRGCTPRHGRTCSTRSCPHWAKAWRRRPGGGLPALRRWPLPRRRGTRGAVRRPAGRRRGAGLPVHGHAAAPAPRWRGTHQAGHGQPQQRRRVVGGGGAGPARRARRRRRRVMRIGTPPGAPPGSPRSGWCPRTVVTSPCCGPRSRRRTGPGRCACGPQWMGRVVNAGVAELCDTVERLGYRLDKEAVRRTVAFYLARTSHGSTLGRLVCAWVTARADRTRSWTLFTQALDSDLADIQGGTTRDGIHLGAMAGTVDMLLRCYTGL